ncbi:M56 family metallopeptidase [Phenylobacterium sp.]|uniref:M56 family metallopeptidase n=1 Tax=Phenylobacterium sp. TaxID=1871053 RepID=UPI0035629933
MQQILASYLLNAVWQIPVVAVCALLISRFAGLSPGARSRLWLAFLAVAGILPAAPLAALLPQARRSVALVPAGESLAAPLAAAPAILPSTAAPALNLAPWSALAMTAFVAVVALALVARLILAGRAARRLVRQARPAILPAEVARALDTLARAHGRSTPPVLRSADVPSPAVVGALRPAILIPDTLAASDQDLRAALLHELAHVLRHDYAVNLACEVLTLPVSWHPALLAIKAGVRRSRELACDAIAAQAMASQKTYAKCLVSLAQTLSVPAAGRGAPVHSALAVGLFGRSDLEDRLMQLMKPRDIEGPFVRAARLCGLAALGAGVLGSAALLHVTPVFAQPATALAATQAADQAQADAAKPEPNDARAGTITSRRGVIITSRHAHHRHSWTMADGQSITVINGDERALTPEEQRRMEQTIRDAEAKAAQAEARVNSPEFKAKIAAAEAKAAAAEAMVNSAEFKARIAQAEAAGAEAERRVNSPEFKARIAQAEAKAAAAERMVNSPEFKAKIAKAQARAEAAEKMVNSPEFKARIARAEAHAARAETEAREFEEDEARRAP